MIEEHCFTKKKKKGYFLHCAVARQLLFLLPVNVGEKLLRKHFCIPCKLGFELDDTKFAPLGCERLHAEIWA